MQINWTPEAENSFQDIVNYIQRKFTQKEVDRFVIQSYQVISVIETHPKLYPISRIRKFRSTRKAVIHPHSTLYYRISNKKEITLILFWDNINDPLKIK